MPDEQPSGHVGVAAVAGQVVSLGREVESLRRMVDTHRGKLRTVDDQLRQVETRVGSFAETLAGVADQLSELAADEDGVAPHTSWFEMDDADTALCGVDQTGVPWDQGLPVCQACEAVARGRMS